MASVTIVWSDELYEQIRTLCVKSTEYALDLHWPPALTREYMATPEGLCQVRTVFYTLERLYKALLEQGIINQSPTDETSAMTELFLLLITVEKNKPLLRLFSLTLASYLLILFNPNGEMDPDFANSKHGVPSDIIEALFELNFPK